MGDSPTDRHGGGWLKTAFETFGYKRHQAGLDWNDATHVAVQQVGKLISSQVSN